MVCCSECGSSSVRSAPSHSLASKIGEFVGYFRVRCEDCGHRWLAYLGLLHDPLAAKCPKCYRTNLTSWNPKYYTPSLLTRIYIALGARRVRCERCRYNFASMKPIRRRRSVAIRDEAAA